MGSVKRKKVNPKAVVLLSGGLDSAVSLWWAKAQGWDCTALSFQYGQRHLRELKSARLLAKNARVPLTVVSFQLPWSQSSLTDKAQNLPHHFYQRRSSALPSTYVPARNTIFLSFGMSLADQIGAQKIVIGANAIDYSGYPDCRGGYLVSFSKTATLGSRIGSEKSRKISVVAPLLKLTKKEIIELGFKLSVPIELTWSCYNGGRIACGECDSCVLRKKGFSELGMRPL